MTDDARVRAVPGEAGNAKSEVLLWWVIFLSLVFRVAFAATVSLGVDESYTAVTARDLHLSYYDHAPLAWWLTWATRHLFDSTDDLVLRLPFILLFSVSTWMMYRLTSLLFDARAGLWAAIVLCVSPVFGVAFGSWILPDAPLMAALLAAGLCLAKLFIAPDGRAPLYWLGAGFFGGLAMLSKYHAVFLFAGAFVFLLTVRGERRWLLRAWPYLGLALAIAMFLPVLFWNAQHDWVSFQFQAERAVFDGLRPSRILKTVVGQAVYLAPWIWVPLVVATFHALRRGPSDGRSWLPICLGMGPVVAFILVPIWSTNSRMYPHWPAPGYLMLIPLLGAAIARYAKRPERKRLLRVWVVGSVLFPIVAAAVVASEVQFGWVQRLIPAIGAKRDPVRDLLDWRELKTALLDRGLLGKRNLFVLVPRWHEAGKVGRALEGLMPILCLSEDARQFGFFNDPRAFDKEDALIVGIDLSREKAERMYGKAFDAIRPLSPITIDHAGRPAVTLDVYYGTRFNAAAPRSGVPE